jgi:transposase
MPKPPAPEPPPAQPEAHNDEAKSRDELLAELNSLRMENAYLKKLRALTQGHAPKERKPFRR